MPKTSPSGLAGKDYQRWYAAGKPDLVAFTAAGCPTASEWKKLQEGGSDVGSEKPAARSKPSNPPAKRKRRSPAKRTATPTPAPATATTPPVQPVPAETSRVRVSVKLIQLEVEGDLGDGLKPLFDQIRAAMG